MDVGLKFPLTHKELLEASGGELARFPASLDEYWDLLKEAEYRADYYQNEIIAMSYETDLHSHLMTEVLLLLKNAYNDRDKYRVHNSNRPIYVKDGDSEGVFNPDGSVVSQPPIYFEYRPGMNAETTPVALFEILSKSTRTHDFGTKLPCYKQIPSLKYIIFIEMDRPHVIFFERQGVNRWAETVYDRLDSSFKINAKKISLKDIYV